MHEYRGKKRSNDTLPPSPEEDEEADATADPPPSPEPEQDAEVMNAVEVLMTINKALKISEQIKAKKRSHHDGASDVEVILPVTKPRPQFPKMARNIILNNKNWMESTVPSVNCRENQSSQIECGEDCKGGEGCSNKRIEKCEVKKVRKERGEKGFSLFADEDIQKGEYVIKYTEKIVYKDPNNKYTMKYKGFDLWVDPTKTSGLAKFMNHSCGSNCVNQMWAVQGIAQLCFFAKRKILKGQELTFSYGWTLPKEDLKQKGTVCLCGAKSCNGTIEKGVVV